jgi:hypothetical protein
MVVSVKSSPRGILGEVLVYEVKEHLRHSQSLILVNPVEKSMNINIQTLPLRENDPDSPIAYSVIYTYKIEGDILPYFIDGYTGACGKNQTEMAARSIVARTEQLAQGLEALLKASGY